MRRFFTGSTLMAVCSSSMCGCLGFTSPRPDHGVVSEDSFVNDRRLSDFEFVEELGGFVGLSPRLTNHIRCLEPVPWLRFFVLEHQKDRLCWRSSTRLKRSTTRQLHNVLCLERAVGFIFLMAGRIFCHISMYPPRKEGPNRRVHVSDVSKAVLPHQ